jgi:hypothetical protein
MSSEELQAAQEKLSAARRTAAVIAFRHLDEVTESEREEVLIALVDALPAREAELAEQMLYHLREERRVQMQLEGIFEAQRTPLRP